MARPLRIEQEGCWYHITARGNERRNIFRDERDRQHWCDLVGECVARFGIAVYVYAQMDNHYHLLLVTPHANLSRTLQWLNLSYAVWFNRRHGRVGHLFQGRYDAKAVEPQTWALELSRYMHLNPVRVSALGLGKSSRQRKRLGVDGKPDPNQVRQRVARLRAYRWSSYLAYVGVVKGPGWLEVNPVLRLIGHGTRAEQQAAYRKHVESAVREGLKESPWEALQARIVLGSAEFVDRIRRGLRGDPKEQPAFRMLQQRVRWEAVVAAVERIKGQRWSCFQDRRGDWGRDLVLYLGRKYCGLTLKELGARVGGLDYRTVSWAANRFRMQAAKNRALANALKAAEQLIQNPEI